MFTNLMFLDRLLFELSCKHTHKYAHTHTHIYRERERERETLTSTLWLRFAKNYYKQGLEA